MAEPVLQEALSPPRPRQPLRLAKSIQLLAASSPILLGLVIVLVYGVNVPVMDQWAPDISHIFIKAHNGQLTLADFWAQHNEHRIVIPRILFFLLGSMGGWNTVREMLAEWAVMGATSVGMLWLCVRTSSGLRMSGAVIFRWFLCNLLIFIPQGCENTVWGMGLGNVMPAAFLVGGLGIAASGMGPWQRTLGAMAMAVAATLSSGNGFLAWPLIGIVLLCSAWREQLKIRRWTLGAWCGGFVLLSGLYFIGYHLPPDPVNIPLKYVGPLDLTYYVLAFLGNAFAFTTRYPPEIFALSVGAAAVLLLACSAGYMLWKWKERRDDPLCLNLLIWISIAGYAACSGIMAALFRARFGIGQAVSSRYVCFSLYLFVGLINLVPLICADLKDRIGLSQIWQHLPTVLLTCLMFLYVLTPKVSFYDLEIARKSRVRARADLLLIRLFPNHPGINQYLAPDSLQVMSTAQALSDIGTIRPPLIRTRDALKLRSTRAAPPGECGKVDWYGEEGGNIMITGHAKKPGTDTAADAVLTSYDDASGHPIIFGQADMGVIRDANTDPSAGVDSQWGISFPAEQFPSLSGRVRIRAWEFDNATGEIMELDGEVIVTKTQVPPK